MVQLPTFTLFLVLTTLSSSSTALVSSPDQAAPYPKPISDLREALVKGLGFHGDDFKVSGFDLRNALVGNSVAYEFDVEVDKKVRPFRLLEDVNQWDYVDLPVFPAAKDHGLVRRRGSDKQLPVLPPFQLAGPMELWIQDADDMRVSLPHDVDAGVLRKVVLADGAVVTVTGARSVSLRRPLDLPLPLNTSDNGFASGLLALSEQLRHVSHAPGSPLFSLRIVGPTSLTSPASSSTSSSNRLKLKRLAPGLVELSSLSKNKATDALSTPDVTTPVPKQFSTLWPIASINGSNAKLVGFEKLLGSVLGAKATREGSFKLLKADVSAQTFVKIGFRVEKKLKEGDGVSWEHFPSWRTKPEMVSMHFEVLARVDGEKVIPERVMQVEPVIVADSVAPNVLLGNITMSRLPLVHLPPKLFTL